MLKFTEIPFTFGFITSLGEFIKILEIDVNGASNEYESTMLSTFRKPTWQ